MLVRVASPDGAAGWGETYGLVAPAVTTAIIDELLADFVVGRDPFDAAAIHDDLYSLMLVRGYTGGFYLDALGAVDIALWDLAGQLSGRPLADLLGGRRRTLIPLTSQVFRHPPCRARAIARCWCATSSSTPFCFRHRGLLDDPLVRADGAYSLPPGPGLDVRPGAEVQQMIGLSP